MVQRAMRGAAPMEVMADLGFGEVHLVDSFAVSMSGALSYMQTMDVSSHCKQGPLQKAMTGLVETVLFLINALS